MLPDLENAADIEIVPENIRAVQAIYAAYLLEEARAEPSSNSPTAMNAKVRMRRARPLPPSSPLP